MKPERLTKPIIYLTVSVWTALLYLNHQTLTPSLLKPLSTVTTVVLYAVMAFDLWLWKLPWLHWFVKRPVIDGIWKVEMRSGSCEKFDIVRIIRTLGLVLARS